MNQRGRGFIFIRERSERHALLSSHASPERGPRAKKPTLWRGVATTLRRRFGGNHEIIRLNHEALGFTIEVNWSGPELIVAEDYRRG